MSVAGKRRWVWLAPVVFAPLATLEYACSTDTFQSNDGGDATAGDAASGDASPPTQADFCDAEAVYYTHCGYTGACAVKDLGSCGSIFASLDPAVVAAFTVCANAEQLDCVDFFTLTTEACMSGHLPSGFNTSQALATLTSDYCKTCGKTDSTCAATFTAINQPGYIAALFADSIIGNIDTVCAKALDGGSFVTDGGTVSCSTVFTVCELGVAGGSLPKDACKEGGL